MPQITNYYGNDFVVGQDSTIMAATQLPDVPAKRVLLRALLATVYVGSDNTVSTATGFPIEPTPDSDEPLELFVGNLSAIWVISTTGGVAWLVQR